MLDQPVAAQHGVAAEDGLAVAEHRPRGQVALGVGERLVQLHRESVGEVVEHVLARGDVDLHVAPLLGRDGGDAPLGQRLAGRDHLHHAGVPGGEVRLDRADQRRRLHRGDQVVEEALLGALERRARRRPGPGVQRLRPAVPAGAGDAGGLQRRVEVVVDDLERAGIGIVDAGLLGGQPMLEQLDRDAAGLDRGDELGAGGEREVRAAPQPEPLRVGEVVHRGGAGGRDVQHAGVGQGVLQSQPGAALLRRAAIAARPVGSGGVAHGVALVEHHHAVEVGPEPIDDLLYAGRPLVPRLGAQRGIGGEQDALLQPDRRALPEAGQRLHQQALLAQGLPVAPGVLDQRVGLRQPQRAAAALQPVVEDHAGDLTALAGAGAVAQHEPAPEADRGLGAIGRGRDQVEGGVHGPGAREHPGMRLAGEDHGLELGVGQQAGGDQARGQMRPVARRGRAHAGHRGRLHQRRGMRPGAGHPERLQRERRVEGVAEPGRAVRHGLDQLVAELHGVGRGGRQRADGLPNGGTPGSRGPMRRRGAGKPDRRAGGAWRHLRLDPSQQGCHVRRHARRDREDRGVGGRHAVDHRQPGLDAGAVPGEHAPVDGGAEHHAPALLQPGEGRCPGRVVGRDGRAGDGDQAAALGQPRQRRGDVADGGVGHAARHVQGGGERRVHQDHAGARPGVEVVVDLRRVEPGDGDGREQQAEQLGADLGPLVQHRRGAGELR